MTNFHICKGLNPLRRNVLIEENLSRDLPIQKYLILNLNFNRYQFLNQNYYISHWLPIRPHFHIHKHIDGSVKCSIRKGMFTFITTDQESNLKKIEKDKKLQQWVAFHSPEISPGEWWNSLTGKPVTSKMFDCEKEAEIWA